MSGRRILILSEPFGMGHTAAAKAMRSHLLLRDLSCQIEVLETSSYLSPRIATILTSAYLTCLKRTPLFWSYLYSTSRQQTGWPQLWSLLHLAVYKEMEGIIAALQPEAIICTHPFPSAIISRLKLAGLTSVPLFTVVTDYCVHASWRSSAVDGYLLPTESIRLHMQHCGVPDNRMAVTGIPIQPKFYARNDKRAARQSVGISDKPTVLVMGGGLGLGYAIDDLKRLLNAYSDLQLLIVAGTNIELAQRISTALADSSDRIRIYGFADNVDELMDASDIVITKPGALTCTEAVAKKLPLILTLPLPGQEQDNSRYLIDHGYAISLANGQSVGACLNELTSGGNVLRLFPGFSGSPDATPPDLERAISSILGYQ